MRVEGCSKISATLRPASACDAVPVGLQLGGAVQQGGQLAGRKLLAGQEMASHPGIVRTRHLEPVPRARPPAGPGAVHLALAAAAARPSATPPMCRSTARCGASSSPVAGRGDWDVALLQEAPPRWLAALRRGCRADGALGADLAQLPRRLRALAADLNPDLIASGEGGSNMVLVRPPGAIEATEAVELARRPERRTMLLARLRLAGGGRAGRGLHAPVGGLHRAGRRTRCCARADARGRVRGRAGRWSSAATSTCARARSRRRSHELSAATGWRRRPAPDAIDHLLARGLAVVDAAARAAAPSGSSRRSPGGC